MGEEDAAGLGNQKTALRVLVADLEVEKMFTFFVQKKLRVRTFINGGGSHPILKSQ